MKILYIEDDIEFIEMVKIILNKKSYTVDYETDGERGLCKASMNYYDLIIIDINLPNKNGLEICKELRNNKNTTPIIFLTSNLEKETLLNAFRIGGDDYIEKPFNKEELILRIETILRRPKNNYIKDKIKCGDFCLNINSKKLFFKEHLITLTKKEYNILELFFRNQNRILDRQEIFDKVWDINDNPLSNTVEVFIKNIRKKINKYTKRKLINNIRCIGYYVGDID